MSDFTDGIRRHREMLSRRRWILGSLLGGLGVASSAWSERLVAGDDPIPADLLPVFEQAKKARLRDFQFNESREKQYVGIGDAPAAFRNEALSICEKLAKVYRTYFEAKGFKVGSPDSRLIIVVLKDKNSYKAFVGDAEGADVGSDVGGHYDVEANQLVVFDLQGNTGKTDKVAAPKRVNTFTLVHESIHQLTYNTGLLERRGDVPVAVSEGFATFGELWQHSNQRATLGVKNAARLDVFLQEDGQAAWIPLDQLLTKDDLFGDVETQQVAYAGSWVLVHHFLKSPNQSKLPKFRDYLEAIRKRTDPSHRLEDARTHLGDLARLDKELKQYRNKQIRS